MGMARPSPRPETGSTLWADVMQARGADHRERCEASREYRTPADIVWTLDLDAAHVIVRESMTGRGDAADVDPRQALIELIAVAAAWVQAMDERAVLTP